MNIYMKQMKKLGLTPKQYAQLINMPYKVVKDVIYEKEGEYSMDIKNILRNDMIKKHQEIEQNKENSKMKALEIKNNDYEFDFLGWYYNEYTKEMLFDKLKVKSVVDFENKYYIEVNGKKASHWFYSVLIPKTFYDKHDINENKKLEFVKQLYDIIVNNNEKEYLTKDTNLQKEIGKHVSLEDIRKAQINGDTNKVQELKEQYIEDKRQQNSRDKKYREIKIDKLEFDEPKTSIFNDVNFEPSKELIDSKNDILRKLLINRLTEEEKMLIELFGGKIC